VKYLDIADHVRTEASGCPDFVIERAVRDSVIEFCIKTDVYRLDPEDIQVIDGIDEYDLTIPVGTELNHIIDIYRGRHSLTPVSYTRLLEVTGDGSDKGVPQYYSQLDNTVFYLGPVPNKNETLKVFYSVKPTSTSRSIPDTIGKEHREALVHGTLYRLQMMANQPWSDMNAAQSNKSLCDQQSAKVMRQVRYGYGGAALKVKARAFI
tara:strand:- start:168 stop:791 length:624 start_codon:yes stop_codon:yes gene_type:complete